MKAHTRLLVAALLFASVTVCWPQAGSSFFDREGVVVAVYTIVHGTMQLDPSVSVAASDRRQYDIVATYVWNALPPDVKSCVSRLDEPTAYVTEYAASDPSEDFAESFAYFVLGPSPDGGTLKDGKIRFFHFFPVLLKDRTFMRAGLASSTDSRSLP